jgi:hypothetical protein
MQQSIQPAVLYDIKKKHDFIPGIKHQDFIPGIKHQDFIPGVKHHV